MMTHRRGFSLMELIFAVGLGVVVMAIGYRAYVGVTRVHDVESRRESMMLTVQNVMAKIKQDTRSAGSVSGSKGSLVIDGGRVVYSNLPDGAGIQRAAGRGRATFEGPVAEFSISRPGVNVTIRSEDTVHRRPIRIEVTSFISPRNR